jgi:hypothetical protein
MRVSFVVYVDFESFSIRISTREPDPRQSSTQKIMKQVPSSFCFYLVLKVTGKTFEPIIYIVQGDEDIDQIFNEKLIEYAHMT